MARKQLRFVMTARMKSARRRETQGKSRKMPIPRYPGFQEKTRTSRWCATEDHNNAGWSTNYMYYRTTNQAPEVTAEPDQQLRVSDWCEDEDPACQVVLRLQSAIQHRLTSRVEENHRNALSRLPGTEMATKTLPILLNRGSKCPFLFNTLPSLKPGWSTAHI